ncbi:MAG: SOS response-associated peptidase [Elusimicrobia bacterium]|nr:SOS response-associated peptidase [Elusimicrobiota bacterium]
MCGRYTQAQSVQELAKRFGLKLPSLALAPRYNIAPNQEAPVVLRAGAGKELALLRWGLVPSWAADASIGAKLINARAESVMEKPSFKGSFKSRRCLVPADGFYEWAKDKTPYRFCLDSQELFSFAGLWDSWEAPDGKQRRTFTIITTDASAVVKPVHGRMPVILPTEKEDCWLEPKTEAEVLKDLLVPFTALKAFPVSTLVNSAAAEGPDCAKPVPLAQPDFWG